MNKKSESRLPADLPIALSANPAINRFVDLLVTPLAGLIEEEERAQLRAETLLHLEALIERYQRQGMDENAATRKALKEYGDADEGAETYLDQWFNGRQPSWLLQKVGHGNLVAFAWFALPQVLYVLLVHLRVYLPSPAYAIPLRPADVRAVWPEPLPYPEGSWSFAVAIGFPLLAPIIVGTICGWAIPVGAARSVYHALMPLILYSFVMGALFLPNTEGLLYALFQVVFWLPVGCLCAHLSSKLARKLRLRAYARERERLLHL